MTFQPGAMINTQGFGNRPENVEVPHYDVRAPASTDVLYPIGKLWLWPANGLWYLSSLTSSSGITTANWVSISDPDGPIQSVVGTSSQVAVSTSQGTSTVSLPAAVTAPGSITSTTTITVGTKLNVTTGANASIGTSDAMTAGVVTVATTSSSATAKIFYSRATTGGTTGQVSITAQDGTGFTLTSTSNTETSTFNWWIINA